MTKAQPGFRRGQNGLAGDADARRFLTRHGASCIGNGHLLIQPIRPRLETHSAIFGTLILKHALLSGHNVPIEQC